MYHNKTQIFQTQSYTYQGEVQNKGFWGLLQMGQSHSSIQIEVPFGFYSFSSRIGRCTMARCAHSSISST